MLREALVLACALAVPAQELAAEALPAGFPLRRGPLVLCHAAELARDDLPASELAWLSRFDLAITNGYEFPSPRVVAALQAAGCRLFRYFWANGFTRPEVEAALPDGDWRKELLSRHPEWLLSPEPLPGPPGTPASYYFDLASPGLVAFLAQQVSATREGGGYAGAFFDYAGADALPPAARELWQRKHPDLPYDRALAGFFQALRRHDPQGLIFTNQACLGDELLLSCVDYDLVESYGTSFAWGPVARLNGEEVPLTFLRPWQGPGGLQDMYGGLCQRLRVGGPRQQLLCLDYMRPRVTRGRTGWQQDADVEAVYYSFCAAALQRLSSFCSGWYGVEYRGPLYFADLGPPLGQRPREIGGLAVRECERGLVALMTGKEPAEATWMLREPAAAGLYDLFNGARLPCRGRLVRLRLTPSLCEATGENRPSARVYLKLAPGN